MGPHEDDILTLKQLGLTELQARVYQALLKLGESRVGAISESSKVARPDIYRVLHELHAFSMVEKTIGRPEEFTATPIEKAVSILLSRRQDEIQKLASTAGSLVKKYAENRPRPRTNPEGFRFVELPERGSILAEILENTKEKTWKTLDIVSSWNRTTRWIVVCQKEISQSLDRGVMIRLIIGKPTEPKEPTLSRLDALRTTRDFHYKLLSSEPPALLNIKDSDEVHLNLNPSQSGVGGFGRCLFSNHPAFVGLARTYFDLLWTNANEQQ